MYYHQLIKYKCNNNNSNKIKLTKMNTIIKFNKIKIK